MSIFKVVKAINELYEVKNGGVTENDILVALHPLSPEDLYSYMKRIKRGYKAFDFEPVLWVKGGGVTYYWPNPVSEALTAKDKKDVLLSIASFVDNFSMGHGVYESMLSAYEPGSPSRRILRGLRRGQRSSNDLYETLSRPKGFHLALHHLARGSRGYPPKVIISENGNCCINLDGWSTVIEYSPNFHDAVHTTQKQIKLMTPRSPTQESAVEDALKFALIYRAMQSSVHFGLLVSIIATGVQVMTIASAIEFLVEHGSMDEGDAKAFLNNILNCDEHEIITTQDGHICGTVLVIKRASSAH